MSIVLVGESGSGKSATSKGIAPIFGLKRMSAGDYFREMAERLGVSFMELEAMSGKDPKHDYEVDTRTREFGLAETNFVFDGRLAAECIPHAFKVLLLCDDAERYRRVAEHRKIPLEQARRETDTREAGYRDRFWRYYRIEDFKRPTKFTFDLTIDTTSTSVADVVGLICKGLADKGHPLVTSHQNARSG